MRPHDKTINRRARRAAGRKLGAALSLTAALAAPAALWAQNITVDPGDVIIGTNSSNANATGFLYGQVWFNPLLQQFGPSYGLGISDVVFAKNKLMIAVNSSDQRQTGRIMSYDIQTGVVSTVVANVANGVGGVAVNVDGTKLYYASNGGPRDGQFDSQDTISSRYYEIDLVSGNTRQLGIPLGERTGTIAVDNDGNLLVGTRENGSLTGGNLYKINTTTGIRTRVGASLGASIGGIVVDRASGNYYVGTNDRFDQPTSEGGFLYEVNKNTGIATSLISTQFENGIGDLDIEQVDGVTTIYIGSNGSEPGANGRVYAFNKNTGSLSTLTNSLANGVGGLAAFPILTDFTGGVNVQIGGGSQNNIKNDPNPYDFYSSAFGAIIDPNTFQDRIKVDGDTEVSVRSGWIKQTTQQEGDLTLHSSATIDIDEMSTANTIVLRASDDVILNGQVRDTVLVSVESVNLTLVADNAFTSGFIADQGGDVLINNLVDINGGTLTTSGEDFTNLVAGTIEAANLNLDHTGAIDFNGAVVLSNDATIVGDTTVTFDADFTADADVVTTAGTSVAVNQTFSSGTFTVNATSFNNTGTLGSGDITTTGLTDLNISGPVVVGSVLSAGTFNSNGTTFVNSATIGITGDDIVLVHTGNVSFNAAVTVAENMTVTGANLDNTGGVLNVTGALDLNLTGNATINAVVTGLSLDLDGSGSFDNNATITTTGVASVNVGTTASVDAAITGGSVDITSGGAFTSSAKIESTGTSIAITATGDPITIGGLIVSNDDVTLNGTAVALNAAATVDDDFTSTGTTFVNTATLDVAADIQLNHSGNLTHSALVDSATYTATGAAFSNTGVITVTGLMQATLTGSATVNETITVGSFTKTGGTSFTSNDVITTTTGNATISGTGALDFNALLDVAGNATLTGNSFDNTGGVFDITGTLTVNASGGPVTVGSDIDASVFTSSGSSFTSTTGVIDVVNATTLNHTGAVTLNSDLLTGSLTSAGTTFNTTAVTTTVDTNMVVNHTSTVDLGNSTIGGLLELNAPTVNIFERTVTTNTLDIDRPSGTMNLSITDGNLIVSGQFFQNANETTTLAGGLLRTSDLQTVGGTFNFLFGEVHVTGNLPISFTAPSSTVLATAVVGDTLNPEVYFGQTLRVNGQTSLARAFEITGGDFITGTITNSSLLRHKSGTVTLTNQDLRVSATGPNNLFGKTYVLGQDQTFRIEDGPSNAGTITIGSDGVMRLDDTGEAYAQNGIVISTNGQLLMNSSVARLSGGTITNSGQLRGTGLVENPLTNQALGLVQANGSERLIFAANNGVATTLSNTNNTNGLISVINGGTIQFIDGLENNGQISGGGQLIFGDSTYTFPPFTPSGGFLRNNSGGRMEFSSATGIFGDVVTAGTVISSGAATTSFFDDVLQTGGELRASSGSRIVYFGVLRGIINRTGTGTHQIEGTQIVGFSPGYGSSGNDAWGNSTNTVFTIDGTVAMDSASAIDYLLNGNVGAVEGKYGVLDISGDLDITGAQGATVTIELWQAGDGGNTSLFSPTGGEFFDVMFFGSITGDVNDISIVFSDTLASGLSWGYEWQSDRLRILINGSLVNPVIPEPSALALLAASGVMALRRRGRNMRNIA